MPLSAVNRRLQVEAAPPLVRRRHRPPPHTRTPLPPPPAAVREHLHQLFVLNGLNGLLLAKDLSNGIVDPVVCKRSFEKGWPKVARSRVLGVNSIESQTTFQQSFYISVGHPVVLKLC